MQFDSTSTGELNHQLTRGRQECGTDWVRSIRDTRWLQFCTLAPGLPSFGTYSMRINTPAVLRFCTLLPIPLATMGMGAFNFRVAEASAHHEQRSEFSIVVNTTKAGIVVTCEEGCAWERVSAEYPGGAYRITEQGIEPVQQSNEVSADQEQSLGFSIIVNTTGDGIAATCNQGCTWERVSAQYPTEAYRITERGVEPTRRVE